MGPEFGDITLFTEALAASKIDPPVEAYLRSVGLSEPEIDEACALYEPFCRAISDARNTPIPDIAEISLETGRLRRPSIN